ncbi:uncharacterized protein LOC120346044 [Styela clava]
MVRVGIILIAFCFCQFTVTKAKGYTDADGRPACTTAIRESERVDCAGDVEAATEGICRSRDCVWCPVDTPNIPYCFHDNTSIAAYRDFLDGQCSSCSYCPYSKDCHPEPGATEAKCKARGCQWCSYPTDISCGPMCMFGGGIELAVSRLRCENCTYCNERLDCHPEAGADPGKCITRGCRWCQSTNSSLPSCVFSDVQNLVAEARSLCNTCASCTARVDCHPEAGATSSLCLARNCIWCPTDEEDQPYCLYGGSTSLTQNYCRSCDVCNTKLPCPPDVDDPTQLQCESYGCLWCPFNSFGSTKCVHRLS